MTDEEYQKNLNSKKFNSICFAKDYIDQILKLNKEVSIEDFGTIMSRVYDESAEHTKQAILEKYSSQMLTELRQSYDK
jgi:hypothetical protein